tara:strand:- start:12803 stop:12973 length:171 start_codon:yes stop_codon:yes gene_type:complete
MIDYQTTTFHMQDFHAGAKTVDKDEHITILYVAAHLVGHHPAEGIKAPAHIRGIGV